MSDYGGYKAIIDEARKLDEQERSDPILACPVCGTVLDKNSRGGVNCPMGHYRADTNARPR